MKGSLYLPTCHFFALDTRGESCSINLGELLISLGNQPLHIVADFFFRPVLRLSLFYSPSRSKFIVLDVHEEDDAPDLQSEFMQRLDK